jgi:hypothetical protein
MGKSWTLVVEFTVTTAKSTTCHSAGGEVKMALDMLQLYQVL